MRRTVRSIAVFLMVSVLLVGVPGVVHAAKVLRFQLVYPKTSMVAANADVFARKVSQYTGGRVEVKLFYPGQLVKSEEGLTALQRGMIDGYIGSMLYFAGIVPETNGQWLPFCWRGVVDVLDVYYNHGYLEVMREALKKHDAYYVAPIMVASMGLMTKFPVRSMEDLKGRSIRAVGMEAKIMKALGATSVAISGAEQYTALQRGTVDGTDYPWYTLEDYRFFEVVKYVSEPALHTPGIVEILMSRRAMERLGAEERQAVERAGFETAVHSARVSEDSDSRARAFAREKGVEFVRLGDADLARFKDATATLYRAHKETNALCARQIEILSEFYGPTMPDHPAVRAMQ